MKTNALVMTGILGWLGGLATMVVSSSCDIIEEPEPNYPDDGTHPDLELVAQPKVMSLDDGPTLRAVAGTTCDLMARPSVVLSVAKRYDDYFQTVDVGAVWYEWDGRTFEAACIPDGDGGCTAWIAGWERPGRIQVSTEYCDAVVDTEVRVPLTEDGCHVQTQYVILPVAELGCLATEPADAPDPDPYPRFG
jgi:hypothetical protein